MEEKIGFFTRIKMSITNFEIYKKFATEKTGKSIKYFFQIVTIFSLLATIAVMFPFITVINNVAEYIKNEMPNIIFEDNQLTLESDEPLQITNDNILGLLIIDTNLGENEEKTYLDKMNQYDNSILFLKEKLIIKPNTTTGYMTYYYKTISDNINIKNFTKQDLINYLEEGGLTKIYISIYFIMLFYLLFTYILVTLLDVALLSILAYLTCKIYHVNIQYKGCFNMAIHALTLPIILNLAYIFINTLTGFKIEYFQIMYNIVSYIYILAAVLIIKSDFDKKGMDIIKIEEKIKRDEIEQIQPQKQEKPEEKKEDTEKKKKEDKKEGGATPEPKPGQA